MSVKDAEHLLLDKTSAFRAWMVYRPVVGVETHRRQLFFGVACGKALPFDRDPEEYPPLHPLPQIIVLNFLSGMRREDNE